MFVCSYYACMHVYWPLMPMLLRKERKKENKQNMSCVKLMIMQRLMLSKKMKTMERDMCCNFHGLDATPRVVWCTVHAPFAISWGVRGIVDVPDVTSRTMCHNVYSSDATSRASCCNVDTYVHTYLGNIINNKCATLNIATNSCKRQEREGREK